MLEDHFVKVQTRIMVNFTYSARRPAWAVASFLKDNDCRYKSGTILTERGAFPRLGKFGPVC